MPTEEIVQMFNELRSDLVLLYELKQAHSNCEYEQQMLRHRYEALLKAGGGAGSGAVGSGLTTAASGDLGAAIMGGGASLPGGEAQTWPSADDIKVEAKEQIIDVVGAPLTPNSVSGRSWLWSRAPSEIPTHTLTRLLCRCSVNEESLRRAPLQ